MLKRIFSEDIQMGMFIVRIGGDDESSAPVPVERIMGTPEEVEAIRRAAGGTVVIDTSRGTSPEGGGTAREAVRVPFADELVTARNIYRRALVYMEGLFNDIRFGRPFDLEGVRHFSGAIAKSTGRNARAAAGLCILRCQGFVLHHSVNVSMLASAFARHVGLGEEQVEEVAVAGLLHDLGKARIPERILNKPGKLTTEEFARMKRHPEFGHELLIGEPSISDPVRRAVLDHHEDCCRSGYPGGKGLEDLDAYTRILTVADVYDALISDRPYRVGMAPNQALTLMYQGRGRLFDVETLERFVHFIGVYPVGSFVRLEDRRYAVVAELHDDGPLHPTVFVVYDEHLRPAGRELLRLSAGNNGDKGCGVAECLNPRDLHIDVERFL